MFRLYLSKYSNGIKSRLIQNYNTQDELQSAVDYYQSKGGKVLDSFLNTVLVVYRE